MSDQLISREALLALQERARGEIAQLQYELALRSTFLNGIDKELQARESHDAAGLDSTGLDAA